VEGSLIVQFYSSQKSFPVVKQAKLGNWKIRIAKVLFFVPTKTNGFLNITLITK